MSYYIQVREFDTDRLERQIGPYESPRVAERAEDGIMRNLDRERFYTTLVEQ